MENSLQEYSLEDCMDAIIDYRGKTPKKTTFGIPLVTAKIIKNGRIQEVKEFIAEEDYDSWMRRGIPETGDIVLTTEAPLGEVAQLDHRKIALAQRVITLRGKKGLLDNDYLKYLLLSNDVQHQLDGRGTGTTVKGIKQSELRKIILKFPEVKIQKSVAHVLKTIDDKIELNRQTNQTLEQMAQVLFKSWFVDFDPVIDNALAAGTIVSDFPEALQHRAEKRKQAQQLPDFKPLPGDIRALFPSGFEQTDEPNIGVTGWIPRGWGLKFLYDLGEFINGAAYKKFEPNQNREGLPIVKIAELKSGVTSNTGFSTVDMPKKYHLIDQDILFSWSGNPDTSIDTFVWARGDAWLNQHIFKVVPNKSSNYSFLFSLLKYLKPEFSAIARDKQTTGLGHVTVKNLKELDVVMPSNELMEIFDKQLHPILERMFLNMKNTQLMEKQRDTLLPKLISGEITIPTDAKDCA
jgi:type I restriction enzyme S subunit